MRAKNRLEQWIGGERDSLWREVMLEDQRARKKGKRNGRITDKAREQRVKKLSSKGKSGNAMQALISAGVAADTYS